jgi:hypothetical protein
MERLAVNRPESSGAGGSSQPHAVRPVSRGAALLAQGLNQRVLALGQINLENISVAVKAIEQLDLEVPITEIEQTIEERCNGGGRKNPAMEHPPTQWTAGR